MVEGRDFYKENGNTVFTRRFLSERGYCCESKCRHCPWYFSRPKRKMRVASLVPSWTETLVAAQVDVAARTRFCIHPEGLGSPAVGGTKQVNWSLLPDADFLLVDREENTKEIFDQSPIPVVDTHVTCVDDVGAEMRRLADIFENKELEYFADRWDAGLRKIRLLPDVSVLSFVDWESRPPDDNVEVLYVIWKDPWMAASPDTYVGSVLSLLGAKVVTFDTKYPQIELSDFDDEKYAILFSSEPYPFKKANSEVSLKRAAYAFVDGESFSWFGIRGLRFLETHAGGRG